MAIANAQGKFDMEKPKDTDGDQCPKCSDPIDEEWSKECRICEEIFTHRNSLVLSSN